MEYSLFKSILDKQIFESSKRDLVEKIAMYPERYIGLFRPTKPKAKILQNLLQSNEIRFGDALEALFERYFVQLGYTLLPKKLLLENDYLELDQLFQDKKYVYFIEQKVRDDHDSSKKRGQFTNFEKKITALITKYQETKLKCFLYFIDPSFSKNKRYYSSAVLKVETDYNITTKLCYGKELWDEIKHPEVWVELLKYLEKWKKEIPDMPSVNLDIDPESTFEEIKTINVSIFRRLFNNTKICKEILPIIFPEKKTLVLLQEYFIQQEEQHSIYKTLSHIIKEYIQ